MISSDDLAFLPLKVNRTGPSGKRTFDSNGKRRLIEACLRPGVSVSGMALKAGINANQLRKWIRARQHIELPAGMEAVEPAPSAFIPVVQIESAPPQAPTRHVVAPPLPQPVPPARLTVRLPNGVTVELACGGHDAALVTAMIAALGAQ
ncbi:MAG TPA: transposase [Burkholderiaceae bacterium]|nr:transposase [Burkholderiaceae bacterium]